MIRVLIGLLAAIVFASTAHATGGAPTLRRPLSVRASSMADAYVGVPGGLSSLGTNPSGLATARRPQLETLFTSGIIDDSFGYFAWAQPFRRGTLAAGLSYYDAGTVNLRFSNGTEESRTAARDFVGHFAWASPLGSALRLGAAGKVYRFQLAEEAKASGFAGDVGAQWTTPLSGLTAGGAIQNLGPGIKFESESDPLPLTMRGGFSWSTAPKAPEKSPAGYVTSSHALATLDIIKTRDESAFIAFGGEFAIDFGASTTIALRVGGRANSPGDRLTFGIGVRDGRFTVDYALGDKGSVGQVHQVGLGVRF